MDLEFSIDEVGDTMIKTLFITYLVSNVCKTYKVVLLHVKVVKLFLFDVAPLAGLVVVLFLFWYATWNKNQYLSLSLCLLGPFLCSLESFRISCSALDGIEIPV